MNRYRPSVPVGKEILLHTLLTQFHPNIFLHTRFGPRGSLALVRARSEKYLDIVMRWEEDMKVLLFVDKVQSLVGTEFVYRVCVQSLVHT